MFGPIQPHELRIAQRVPQEILLEIFRRIPFAPAPYRDTIVYPYLESREHARSATARDTRAGLPLVCQRWNGPATEILYEEVDVTSLHAAKMLLQALESARGPALGDMIKTLRLPARADVGRSRRVRDPFPGAVPDIIEGIVRRCSPALKSLSYSTAATQPGLGIFWEPRFPQGIFLTNLHLSSSYSIDGAPLPPLDVHRHLQSATLASFVFDRTAGVLSCPASLRSLTLNSCIFDYGWDVHHPDPAMLTSLTFNICTCIDSQLPAHLLEHLESLDVYRTPSLSYDLARAPHLTQLALAPSQSAPQFGWGEYVPHGVKRLTLGVFDPHDIEELEILVFPLARDLELVRLYICCKLDTFESTCLDRISVQLRVMGVQEVKVIWDARVDEWILREWILLSVRSATKMH